MNHNYQMAHFTAQERIQARRNEAHIHRTLQATDSQNTTARFSWQLNRLYQQMATWKLANFLAAWQTGRAFRYFIYKHS